MYRRPFARCALLCALVTCAGLSAQRARACSGPFYSGPATVPFTGSTGVPVNALIQVQDEGGRDDALEVTLWANGAPGATLSLARQDDRAWFVGTPTDPLAAHTDYEVRVDRALFCSWLPLATISYEYQPSSPMDEAVVLTAFRTSAAFDQQSPVAGEGHASFTYGEVFRASIAYLRAEGAQRIVLAGISAGAIGASQLAPRLGTRVDAMVLVSGVSSRAGTPRVPTLLVQGDHDAMVRTARVRSWAGERPGVRYRELPGTHFVLLEQREAIAEALSGFLREVATRER